MPTILVTRTKNGKRELMNVIFPCLTREGASGHSRWEWPELRVGASSIQGFGLFPQSTESFDWSERPRPFTMPYLGKETEVESSVQARVLRSVLCGCFDVVERQQLVTPPGHEWVQDGLYVQLMTLKERRRLNLTVISEPDIKLLQVPIEPEASSHSVSYLEEGDEQVCYLLHEETRELLHLPPHIFEVLRRTSPVL